MLGIYNYTVILTYANAVSGALGIYYTLKSNIFLGIIFLIMSGIFDLFDGAVANTKKNRNDRDIIYGIQIDSFADIISFCVLPTIIGYALGHQKPKEIIIYSLFILAGLIRLAYFNVTEIERKKESQEKRKYYTGLPVTSVAFIIPFIYFISNAFSSGFFKSFYMYLISLIGLLFVSRVKIKKIDVSKLVHLFSHHSHYEDKNS